MVPTKEQKIKAVLDAREPVAKYLLEIGKIEAFANFSKDDICGLIKTAKEACDASLKEQMRRDFEDEIPF